MEPQSDAIGLMLRFIASADAKTKRRRIDEPASYALKARSSASSASGSPCKASCRRGRHLAAVVHALLASAESTDRGR